MRLESIKVQNFRQLKDLTLKFNKISDKNDIHVILAENGVGKTNIMNAITWCLYDNESHLRNEDTALHVINSEVLEYAKQYGGSINVSVELEFSTSDVNNRITFTKTAIFKIYNDVIFHIKEDLIVTIMGSGGHIIIENEEEARQIIHKYLPEEINNYIFFDGEQLEEFFSRDQTEKVRQGINDLTQASYLEKATLYLEKYIKTEILDKLKGAGDKELEEKQANYNNICDEVETSISTIQQYSNQIDESKKGIEYLTTIIRGNEIVPEKVRKLEELEKEIVSSQQLQEIKYKELMNFTRENYFLLSIYPSLKCFGDYIHEKDKEGSLPPRVDKKLLQGILQSKHCPICNTYHLPEINIDFVRKLENSLAVASETSAILNKASGSLDGYYEKVKNYHTSKERILSDIEQIKNLLLEKNGRAEELRRFLNAVPDITKVVESIKKRKEYNDTKDKLIAKKAKEEVHLQDLRKKKNQIDAELKALLKKNKKMEKLGRQKDFCERCVSIMRTTKSELLDECRQKIQNETFQLFNELIWKKKYFSKIEILEDYTFRLLDMYGNQCLGSCSAAETALLALSFTLALQDVSKHDALLFIDTPIGRVGAENRTNFMSTLLDVSVDKQVILTFTPTEYDNNVKNIISNKISNFYHLDMNNEGVTYIKNK
ncbi:MAG: AAA family ATPase [Bacteroidaceae bacterium]|nr:AAA family ATPase [Bacteroidaceae bacterium]